jgi:cobyrinic acid a,c-diamide synthase
VSKDVKKTRRLKVAVAYDKAFNFYYEDNLDLLKDAGVEIMRFSPLADAGVPETADAVYLGGGYPELHADALSRNTSMLDSIYEWADAGRPLYAECGGLMYLSRGIRDFDDNFFEMAAIFPFESRMMKKPRLGYREIVLNEDCILGAKGEKCRGHEFHYSEIIHNEDVNETAEKTIQKTGKVPVMYSVRDSRSLDKGTEGYRYKTTLASYIHVHFGSNPRIPERFAAFIKGERKA